MATSSIRTAWGIPMSASENYDHKLLMLSLIRYLKQQGCQITNADSDGYPQCDIFEGHKPDMMGKDTHGLLVVGEVKTKHDLEADSENIKGQFEVFSSLHMGRGELAGARLPFFIGVPKVSLLKVQGLLREAGIAQKPNIHIIYFQ